MCAPGRVSMQKQFRVWKIAPDRPPGTLQFGDELRPAIESRVRNDPVLLPDASRLVLIQRFVRGPQQRMRHSPRTIHPDGLGIRTTVNQKICERLQQCTLNRLTVPMNNTGDATQSICLSVEGPMLRTSKRGAARRHPRPECVPRYPELGIESLLGENPILPGRLASGNRVILTEARNLSPRNLRMLSAIPRSSDPRTFAFQPPISLASVLRDDSASLQLCTEWKTRRRLRACRCSFVF